jgi:hypothetical protein
MSRESYRDKILVDSVINLLQCSTHASKTGIVSQALEILRETSMAKQTQQQQVFDSQQPKIPPPSPNFGLLCIPEPAPHETVQVWNPLREEMLEIDTLMAPLLSALWKCGVSTLFSCQGSGAEESRPVMRKMAYVKFGSLASMLYFLDVLEQCKQTELILSAWASSNYDFEPTVENAMRLIRKPFEIRVDMEHVSCVGRSTSITRFPQLSGSIYFAQASIIEITRCFDRHTNVHKESD